MTNAAKGSGAFRLACGVHAVEFVQIDSTNAEALRQAQQGVAGPLWISAERQSAGRGRLGRSWASEPGNLLATLLLRLECPPPAAAQISLLAGVAAIEAISNLSGPRLQPGDLRLKWPNDVLLGGAKLAGILAESTQAAGAAGGARVVALGTGINLASAPREIGRPATCLADRGILVSPRQMLEELAATTKAWLARWHHGRNFAAVCEAWLAYGPRSGELVTINAGSGVFSGSFAGLGAAGELRLSDLSGRQHEFSFGDVADPTTSARAVAP